MPVLKQTPAIDYIANGSVSYFTYPFQVLDQSDLYVYVNGVLITDGIAITGIGEVSGGQVVFGVPPVSGAVVRIVRKTSIARITDYLEGGVIHAETLDTDFDRIVMMVQEVNAGNLILAGDGRFEALSRRIKNVADPVDPQDAVTKIYADSTIPAKVAEANASAASAAQSVTDAANLLAATDAVADQAEASAVASANSATASANSAAQAASLAATFNTANLVQISQLSVSGGANKVPLLDASGNFGLGVTPSAWHPSYKAVQIGSGSVPFLAAPTSSSGSYSYYGVNCYLSSGGNWTYLNNQPANLFTTEGGSFRWYQNAAGSGTFTPANTMTLDALGNLAAVGAVSDAAGNIRDVPANAQAASYNLALTDRGKSIDTTSNVNILGNSGVAFPIGSTITVTNVGSGSLSIVPAGATVLRQAGTTNSGTRTLGAYGVATLRKIATDIWIVAGAGLS